MASTNWTALTGALGSGDAAIGVTEGATPPNGGGTFVYGARSKTATEGVIGFYHNGANFTPQTSGGHVYGAITRNAGDNGNSPVLFQSLQSTLVSSSGYLLGLTDDTEPANIILKKGAMSDGMASNDSGILRTSTASFAKGSWLHLRLDVIEQPSGDVRLRVFANDLSSNAVTSPSWAAITGMADFIDDALGVNSGSVPYIGGYAGFGGYFNGINRVLYFDHMEIARQV